MTCRDVREHLTDLSRGQLSAEVAANVRAHLVGCPACSQALRGEEQFRALVRGHAPRYTAPPALQARVRAALRDVERPPRTVWRDWVRHRPWLKGSLVGAMAAVAIVWAGGAWLARDPVARLVAAAVDEHVEYAQEAKHRPVPDAEELLRRVQSEAGFLLGPVFRGDAEAPLILAAVTEVRGKPGGGLGLPERTRTLHDAAGDARCGRRDSGGGPAGDRELQAASPRGVEQAGAVLEAARRRVSVGLGSRPIRPERHISQGTEGGLEPIREPIGTTHERRRGMPRRRSVCGEGMRRGRR